MPSITDYKDNLAPRWNPWNQTGAGVTISWQWVLVIWFLACVWSEVCYSNEAQLREHRKSLPTTTGQIVQVKKEGMSSGSPSVTVNFKYSVAGKEYTSEQADFTDSDYAALSQRFSVPFTIFNSPAEAEKVAARYEGERSPTVHFDPTNPATAFIDVGYSGYSKKMWVVHLGLIVSLILSVVWVILPLAGYQYRRGA